MRWLSLTSKTWRVNFKALLWPLFPTVVPQLSGEACDLTRSSLGVYPCCCHRKAPNNATFTPSGVTSQWPFHSYYMNFPLFFLSFWLWFFISCCSWSTGSQWSPEKEVPVLWRGTCWEYLWIIISVHFKSDLRPVFFWHLFCACTEWYCVLGLNHAVANLIEGA